MTKLTVAFHNFANAANKQDAWEKLKKEMNRPVDECKKNGEFVVSSETGKNENEEKHWHGQI